MISSIKCWSKILLPLCLVVLIAQNRAFAQETNPINNVDKTVYSFVSLLFLPDQELTPSMNHIEQSWQPAYAAMALDILALNRRPSIDTWLYRVLREKSAEEIGDNLTDMHDWLTWLWNAPEQRHEHYGEFKSIVYSVIDKKFRGYFSDERTMKIRLDEVRWGGVRQDGIPPLRQPRMVEVDQAEYLGDDDKVFGIEINGDARAYPNRILAWHEMFVDTVGGVKFAGVYCTLCGAVILYETELDGVEYQMGTSGFLYRSNKLMYDRETQSLWSTTRGEPVIGPLADKNIRLKRSYVVTTTWGEWKKRHPDTKVLALQTGFQRDYAEGAAYKEYFATDELMFNVPKLDERLKNKDEVFVLTFPEHTEDTMAMHDQFLAKNPVYHDALGGVEFVVLTDASGANRAYQTDGLKFSAFDQNNSATDSEGITWQLDEDALTADDGRRLERLPGHRAFWFGWYAVHNDTRLVH